MESIPSVSVVLLLMYLLSAHGLDVDTSSPLSSSTSSADQQQKHNNSSSSIRTLGWPPHYSTAATRSLSQSVAQQTTHNTVPPAQLQLLPMVAQDVALFILSFIILALAAAAGIGGGVLLVPLLSTVGGFQFIETVALSNLAIFAGSIANLVFNMPRRNPVQPGPLIDYDLLLLFGPPIVIGSVAGSKVNYFVPSWIPKALVLLVLTPATWRMVQKAKLLWVAESQRKQQALADITAAAAAAAEERQAAADSGDPEQRNATAATSNLTACGRLVHSSTDPYHSHHKQSSLSRSLSEGKAGRAPTQAAHGSSRWGHSASAMTAVHDDIAVDFDGGADWEVDDGRVAGDVPDLVGLLGPELMLLTSPAAAAATTEIQHSSRELLQQQRSMGWTGSLTVPSFLRVSSMPVHRLQAGDSFVGRSFRGSRSTWVQSFADRAPGNNRISMRHSTPAIAAASAAAAAAAAGGSTGSFGISQATGRRDGEHQAADSQQQQQQRQSGQKQPQGSEAETGHADQGMQQTDTGAAAASDAASNAADSFAGSSTSHTYPDVVSPFLLHQRERLARQASLGLRQNSSRSMRLCMDHIQLLSLRSNSQLGAQASLKPSPDSISGEQPAKQPEASSDVELGCKADKGVAVAELGVAGEGHQLAAVDRCGRLRHEGCCHSPQLEKRMQEKMQHHLESQYPKAHIAALLSMLLLVVAATVSAHFLLICGTWQYWLLVLSPLPVMAAIWAVSRWHVLWRVGWQDALGLTSLGDLDWTPRSTLVYPAVCISVGLLAGLLGLGGGFVMAPMLLELGVHPSTAAASSQAAMLVGSCTSSVVYLVNSAVPHDYGISMAIIGLTATLLGQTVISYLVKLTGRSSLLVWILTVLFVLALGAGLALVGIAVAGIVADTRLVATRQSYLCHRAL